MLNVLPTVPSVKKPENVKPVSMEPTYKLTEPVLLLDPAVPFLDVKLVSPETKKLVKLVMILILRVMMVKLVLLLLPEVEEEVPPILLTLPS